MKSLNTLFLASALGLAVTAPVYAQGAGIALGTIEASSTRGAYFQANVNDGNLTSAWGPHADDLMPSLTFNLGRAVALSALEIKVSPAGAIVDVEMHQNGTWRTVASGQRPQAEPLARISLPNAQGDRVRLKFRGVDAGQLLVAEVRLYGEGATWTPAPTPTPVVPVPVPTATTGTGPCTDVIGGGWVTSAFSGKVDDHRGRGKGHDKHHGKGHGKGHDKKDKKAESSAARVTFGFAAHERVDRADWGNIEVNDHGGGQRFKGNVTSVTYQGRTATFTGTLRSGGTFTAVVTDNGEPGRSDRFRFTTSSGYTADGVLKSGNIQVKRRDCR